MITPKDIQMVEFPSSMRGYGKREVDEFLDRLTEEVQFLLDENRKLKEENDNLNAQIEESKKSSESVVSAIEQAKRLMNDISTSAEKRAETIIRNANMDAEDIVRKAKESVVVYTEESEKIKSKVEDFRNRFKKLLADELSRVDNSVDDLFEELRTDFYPEEGSGTKAYTRAFKRAGITQIDADTGSIVASKGNKEKVDDDIFSQIDREIALSSSAEPLSKEEDGTVKYKRGADMSNTIIFDSRKLFDKN